MGFVARPVGAAIFGHYGDRIGRKSTLIATLLLMRLATFAVFDGPQNGKVAFSNYALVLFAGTLDSIFKLAPTVRKLFGHLVGSARHVTTYDGPEVYDLTDLEFM